MLMLATDFMFTKHMYMQFSLAKLNVVGHVIVLGMLLQIAILAIFGAKLSEDVFVGSFLSMSSTTVVVQFSGGAE
ncbi:hypothetical protein VNO78_12833 [Psophocarpus tetragonolobus]|uniref:Uncharacterized protein n=1 Tax=Psophocarpus tetragonolobus TaxID=3891 RepID=A0AAN9XPI4_PSOTE